MAKQFVHTNFMLCCAITTLFGKWCRKYTASLSFWMPHNPPPPNFDSSKETHQLGGGELFAVFFAQNICILPSPTVAYLQPCLLSSSSLPLTESLVESRFPTLYCNALVNDKLMKSCFFRLGEWSFDNGVGIRPGVLYYFAWRVRTN